MTNEEQKKIWKQEKEQLKKDKLNQKKEVYQRPVNLKFGGANKKTSSQKINNKKPSLGNDVSDNHLKQQLNINFSA